MTNNFRLLSSAQATQRIPDARQLHPKRAIFISAEGTVTEPDYFRHLFERLVELKGRELPFVLVVLDHDGDGASDPRNVLGLLEECFRLRNEMCIFPDALSSFERDFNEERIYRFFKEPTAFPEEERMRFRSNLMKMGIDVDYCHRLSRIGVECEEDVFAVVVDRDRRNHSLQALTDIRNACRSRGFVFCVTNPCFELWLLLHFCDVARTWSAEEMRQLLENDYASDEHTFVSARLRRYVRHKKHIPQSMFDDQYFPKIADALRNLNGLATNDEDALNQVGSTLHELMREMGYSLESNE